MKILAVRGKNLASLAGHFEVDFCKAPLDRAGLIAITGPTGAGKTTLLDAMCLALFDRTPRFAKRDNVMIGATAGDDGLRASDVRGILRHGAVEGWAEVDFSGIDDRRWRARWEVRRARGRADGRIQPQQRSLIDAVTGRPLVADRKSDVQAAIEERLGLDFDQFRRSVLLAQGEFAAFLEASGNQRAELLERMTGTGLYRELGRGAFERAKLADQELTLLSREREQLAPLDDEARAALEAQVQERGRALAAVDGRRDRLEATLRWHRRRAELEAEVREARRALAAIEVEVAAARVLEQELVWIERLGPLRARREQLEALRLEIDEREQERTFFRGELTVLLEQRKRRRVAVDEAEQALGRAQERRRAAAPELDRARELDSRRAGLLETKAKLEEQLLRARAAFEGAGATLAQTENTVAQTRAQLEGYERWLAAHQALVPLLDSWGHYRLLLTQQLRDRQQRETLERRRDGELEPRLQQRTAALAEARVEFEGARKQRKQAQARLAKVTRDIEAQPPVATLRARARVLERARQRAEALRQHHEADQRAAQLLHDLAGERRDQELERDARRERSEILAQEFSVAEAGFAEAQRSLRLLEATRDLAAHRADLRPGEACPLCGALEHPRATGPVDEAIAAQRARIEELLRRREDLQREQGELRSRIQVAQDRLVQIEGQRRREVETSEGLRASWRAVLDEGPILPAEGGDAFAEEAEEIEEPAVVDAAAGQQLSLLGAASAGSGERLPRDLEDPRVQAALWSLFAELTTRSEALDQTQRRVDELIERQRDRQARRDEAEQLCEARREQVERLEREQQALGRDLAEVQARLAALDLEIADRWSELADTVPAALACLDADRGEGGGNPDLPARLAEEGAALIDALGDACKTLGAQQRHHQHTRDLLAALAARQAEQAAVLEARRERFEALTGELGELGRNLETLVRERAELLGGASVAVFSRKLEGEILLAQGERDEQKESLAKLEAEIRGCETRVKSLESQLQSLGSRRETAEAAAGRALAELLEGVEASGEEGNAEAIEARLADAGLWDEDRQRRTKATIEQIRSTLERQRAVVDERRRVLQAHLEHPAAVEEAGAGETSAETEGEEAAARCEAELRTLETEAASLRTRLLEAELELRRDSDARTRASALGPTLVARERDARVWGRLRDVIGSASGDKFQRFAQSLTLELLLAQANASLRDLKPRYSLARVPNHDLELQLIDHDLGDEVRSIRGLSGGETFLVSLALALGLASLSAEDCRLDSLFIDEGF
ncbi:MAG: AAA family ATPase, partial [Myxococcales bacterium]|nr:AAA family ATPase [Myxococcales bacterium]